jgi:hypothetical protein
VIHTQKRELQPQKKELQPQKGKKPKGKSYDEEAIGVDEEDLYSDTDSLVSLSDSSYDTDLAASSGSDPEYDLEDEILDDDGDDIGILRGSTGFLGSSLLECENSARILWISTESLCWSTLGKVGVPVCRDHSASMPRIWVIYLS